MGRSDALHALEAMGCRVVVDDGTVTLALAGETLDLGDRPDWDAATARASDWVNGLTDKAAQRGAEFARRREACGFTDRESFEAFTGLDADIIFEVEHGLVDPQPVHARILDWLEEGRLTPTPS